VCRVRVDLCVPQAIMWLWTFRSEIFRKPRGTTRRVTGSPKRIYKLDKLMDTLNVVDHLPHWKNFDAQVRNEES
jgi:hypothetical protein